MARCVRYLAYIAIALMVLDLPLLAQTPKKRASTSKVATQPESAPETAALKDMALGRLASEKGLAFFASNGWRAPAAGSTNKTERLWAQKSVRVFVQQLRDEILKTIRIQFAEDETSSMLATTIPVLVDAVIRHPLAMNLINFATDESFEVNFFIVIDVETDAAAVRDAFTKTIKVLPRSGDISVDEEVIDAVTFYRVNLPEPLHHLAPRVGMAESYLILSIGQNMAADTLKLIKSTAKSPEWLNSTISEAKIERPSLAVHVDVESILKTVDPLIDDPMVRSVLDATGLLSMKKLTAVSGFDAIGVADRMVIETNGPLQGVMALLPQKPLSVENLKVIPENATDATIVRLDIGEFIEKILWIADKISPEPRQQYEMAMTQAEQFLGFSVENDLFAGLGDVVIGYMADSSAGAGLVPAVVLATSVRDPKKLRKVQDVVVERLETFLTSMGAQAPFAIEEFSIGKTTGYQIPIKNIPAFVTPSWAISDNQLVIGISPEVVTAHLAVTGESKTLADQPEITAAFKRSPKPTFISYRDPKPGIQGLITTVNAMWPLMLGPLHEQGIDFNLPRLPPASDIEQHLLPTVTMISRESKGWTSESHGVVSTASPTSIGAVAVVTALLLPAVQQAREAARRTQSKNNLKQIALSMHNYHETHDRFPDRTIRGSDKKPKLSWRVSLLPFLDEQALYDEFHLDEDWDSEHNRQLIPRIPLTYVVPGDDSKMGKTRYLVPSGEKTLFDGDKGPRIRDITDGTSNTIMAVEACADHAVVWTAPDDLEVDFDDPLAGLKSARTGGFHAIMADGSVRFISDLINIDTLKGLFTKAGGETIGDF